MKDLGWFLLFPGTGIIGNVFDVCPVALQESRERWDSKGDTHQEAQQEEEDEAQQGEHADEDDGPELKL